MSEFAPRLRILCITTGRPTLTRALESLQRQTWLSEDEVWLVNDGPNCELVRNLWERANLPGRLIMLEDGPHGDWGHSPRNKVLPKIRDGYVVNFDDDDALAPGALNLIRRKIVDHPGAFFFFRVAYPDGGYLWSNEEIRRGNVGTGLFVHPAGIPMGQYLKHREGDFEFVAETLQRNPGRPVIWCKEAYYVIRPHESWIRPDWTDGSEHPRETGREDCQAGWHEFFGRQFEGQHILDVGAGLGHSKSRLAAGGNRVTTHDVASGLPVDFACNLSVIPDGAFDVVCAFDVIEHIPAASEFLAELHRITRRAVVLTTPNVWVSKCRNPHHIREYSPPAFLDLIAGVAPGKRLELLASPHWNGSAPVTLTPESFLGTSLPVFACVVWK